MSDLLYIGLIIALALFTYLLIALFKPERLQ